MTPIPSCATTFLCAKSPALLAQLLTVNMQSPIPSSTESSELLPAACQGKGFGQGALVIAMDAAGWQYFAWLSRHFVYFTSLASAIFLSVEGKGKRWRVSSPTQPHSAEVSDTTSILVTGHLSGSCLMQQGGWQEAGWC